MEQKTQLKLYAAMAAVILLVLVYQIITADIASQKMLVLMGLAACGVLEALFGWVISVNKSMFISEMWGKAVAVMGVATLLLTVAIWQLT